MSWRTDRPEHHFKSGKAFLAWNTRFAGTDAGSSHGDGYYRLTMSIDGKRVFLLAHRVIIAIETGKWPTEKVDHRNGNCGDNTWDNLREATIQENTLNRCARKTSKTGFKGVNMMRAKYEARIMVNGKSSHLGYFETAEAAHTAYHDASLKLHGAFARSH